VPSRLIFINVSTNASFQPLEPSLFKFVTKNLMSSELLGGIHLKRMYTEWAISILKSSPRSGR